MPRVERWQSPLAADERAVPCASGPKHFHHPVVGTLALAFDAMDLPADSGLTLTAYTAEPGSPSADALTLLASWTAITSRTDRAETDQHARSRSDPAPGHT